MQILSDADFIRYQRQVALSEVGEQGQSLILKSRVLVFGCGGLGSVVTSYLIGAGIGTLKIVDHDYIDISNLHRQLTYREGDIGQSKSKTLRSYLKKRNSSAKIKDIDQPLAGDQLSLEVMLADVVVDCTDNFPSRHKLNRVCHHHQTPLVSGSAAGWSGQFSVYRYLKKDSPCYECLYPNDTVPTKESCASMGVIGPVVSLIGSLQALAVIRLLINQHCNNDDSKLTVVSGLNLSFETFRFEQDPSCGTCLS